MRTALEHYGTAGPGLAATCSEIRQWLQSLPDAPFSVHEDGLWSCHAVARAVYQKWALGEKGWRVEDGHFRRHYQHSWIESEALVMDVYPVGSLVGPLVLDRGVWGALYASGVPTALRDQSGRDEAWSHADQMLKMAQENNNM